jgi:hypothetical protein
MDPEDSKKCLLIFLKLKKQKLTPVLFRIDSIISWKSVLKHVQFLSFFSQVEMNHTNHTFSVQTTKFTAKVQAKKFH